MRWCSSVKLAGQEMSGGFTLTELVVTLSILALLLAIVVPTILAYMPSYHLKQATRNIVSQMQLARINAIKNRVRTVGVFSPAAFSSAGQAGSYKIYRDSNTDWKDAGETEILATTVMPRRVTLISAVFTDSGSAESTATRCFGFDPGGVAARTGGTYVTGSVQLQNSRNATRTITFYASGKVQITIP